MHPGELFWNSLHIQIVNWAKIGKNCTYVVLYRGFHIKLGILIQFFVSVVEMGDIIRSTKSFFKELLLNIEAEKTQRYVFSANPKLGSQSNNYALKIRESTVQFFPICIQ